MEPYFNPDDPTFSESDNSSAFQIPNLGYFSNLLDTVKTQTKQVVNVCKRDLNEFVSQVKTESGVDRISQKVPEQAKQFIQQTTQFIENSTIKKTTMELYEKIIQEEKSTVLFEQPEEMTGWAVLRLDEATYTQDPNDMAAFESFEFDYISKLSDIAELLAIPTIQQYHEKLGNASFIDTIVNNEPFMDKKLFWKRYFFKFEQWNAVNEQRKALLQHLEVHPTTEQSLGWDDEDDEQETSTQDLPLDKESMNNQDSKLSDSFIVVDKEQGDWDDWE